MSESANKTQKDTGSQTQKNAIPDKPSTLEYNDAWGIYGKVHSQAKNQISPSTLTPKKILQLQRTVGNQAVLQLFRQDAVENKAHVPSKSQTQVLQRQDDITSEDDTLQRDTLIQREVSEEDIEWSNTVNGSVERVQDAIGAATRRLNADARLAIGHIREAQTQYDNFEAMYEAAVGRFVGGVEAASAREQEFRDNIKFVATAIFAQVAPTASAMYAAIDGALTKVQRVSSIMAMTTTPAPAADASGGTSPAMAARGDGRVQWSELLTTTLTAFETTVQNNQSLSDMATECISLVRFLDSVQEGRYTGDAPQSSTSGTRASDMHTNVTNIIRDLGAIDEGTVSGPTETLKNSITERVGTVTGRQLEQDIAIRWMGGLASNELDKIDLADAYLARIGVFDSGDNRLDYDTGNITTSDDERILHWRASWESTAMGLVGSTVLWLGHPFIQPGVIEDERGCREVKVYSGQVRDNHNNEWNVDIPRGVTPEGGGSLLITGYTVDHMDSSGWEWSRPGDLRQRLKWEIRFTAQPAGPMGGGAPAAGPVMNAAP